MKKNPGDELKELLQQIAGRNLAAVTEAHDALLEAAAAYMSSRPSIDENGRRSRLPIAIARAGLKNLHKKLLDAQRAAKDLPANALAVFCDSYENSKGALLIELELGLQAADRAVQALKGQPDKAPDFDRNVLACDVAVVLRDILKLKPASTRDTDINVTGKLGGAAYARTLRATLKVAGVTHVDIGPLIDAGLRLLSDETLPNNLE